jgi:PAS domain S-box-containing protein
VAAGFLETEALATERRRVSELEAHIAELRVELERALASAAEHRPAPAADQAGRRRSERETPRPGIDDVDTPRALIALDGRFTALNDGFCELVGYSESEFRRASWPPVIDVHQREKLRRLTARVVSGSVADAEIDTFYMTGNGTLVQVLGTLRLERDSHGAAAHLVLDARPLAALAA